MEPTGETMLAPPAPGEDGTHNRFVQARASAGAPQDGLTALMQMAQQPGGNVAPAPTDAPNAQVDAPAPPAPGAVSGNPVQRVIQRLTAPNQIKPALDALGTAIWPQGDALPHGKLGTDVAKGTIESPLQALGGVLDYGNNIFHAADDIVKWGEAHGLPNVYFQAFDDKGNWAPKIMSTQEARAAMASGETGLFQVPTTGGASTVTGGLVRGLATFMAARGVVGKIGMDGTMAGRVAGDALAGATGLNPQDDRLSNMIQKVAPNFLTEWLQAKPEDEGTLLGRLKSGLEMAGVSSAFAGAVKLLKAFKTEAPGAGSGWTGDAPANDTAPPAGTAPIPAPGEAVPPPAAPGETPAGTPSAAGEKPPAGSTAAPGTDLQAAPFDPNDPFAHVPQSDLGPGKPAAKPVAVEITGDVQSAANDLLSGKQGVYAPMRLNLDYIASDADVKHAMGEIASHIEPKTVQSNQTTILLADSLGMSASDVLNGATGSIMDASQQTALRFMLDDATAQVLAASKNAGTADGLADFNRKLAATLKIMTVNAEQGTETGRALQARQIMSQNRPVQFDAVQALLKDPIPDAADLAEKINTLNDPAQASRFLGQAARAPSGMFMNVWYNSLLSSPTTVVKKLLTDVAMGGYNLLTRYVAETWGSGAVQKGETAALYQGFVESQREALRMGGAALKAGRSQFHPDAATLDANYGAAAHLPDGAADAAGLEYLRAALPTSWISGADDWAKFWNFRGNLRALALRAGKEMGLGEDAIPASGGSTATDAEIAARRMSLAGETPVAPNAADGGANSIIADVHVPSDPIAAPTPGKPSLSDFVRQSMDAPPDALAAQAWAEAARSTFTEKLTGNMQRFQELFDNMNVQVRTGASDATFNVPVGRILMPFIKVPANITAWTYRNTALQLAFPTDAVKSAMANGGAEKDLMMARIKLGSGLAVAAADLALQGTLTGSGPQDPELRGAWVRAGNQPYSIRIGDTRYSYPIEPFGMLLGAVSDTVDIMKFARQEDAEQLAASVAFGLGNALLSKSYMVGISNFFHGLANPQYSGAKWAESLANSLVPSGVARMASGLDTWQRAHYDMIQSIETRLPFVRNDMPPQRSIWGDPVPLHEAFMPPFSGTLAAHMISPIDKSSAVPANPIDDWVWKNRDAFPRAAEDGRLGLTRMGQVQNFTLGSNVVVPVHLTPQELDKLQVLAGNGLKDPATGFGAKDYLNALVTGDLKSKDPGTQAQFDRSSPAAQALIVGTIVRKFRDMARQQLLAESPDLQDRIGTMGQARATTLSGGAQSAGQPATPTQRGPLVMPNLGGTP